MASPDAFGRTNHVPMLRTAKLITVLMLFCGALRAEMKRVIILKFVNLEKNGNLAYLEESITDSVRFFLNQSFAFREAPAAEVEKFARENYFDLSEVTTMTMPLRLGIELNQDMLIAGGYEKAPGGINVHARIFDIAQRKLHTEFSYKVPTDNRLFGGIESLSQRIAKEADGLLTNKGEYQALYTSYHNPEYRNQFTMLGGVRFASLPGGLNGNLAGDTKLTTSDFNNALAFGADYQRHGFSGRFKRFFIFGLASGATAKNSYVVSGHRNSVTGSLTSVGVNAGIGYKIFGYRRFYIHGILAPGFEYSLMNFNFSNLAVLPISLSTGKEDEAKNITVYGPTLRSDVRLGLALFQWTTLEMSVAYQNLFLSDRVAGAFSVSLGIGWKL